MTCSIPDNICAQLCGNTAEERKNQLKDLYNGNNISFNTYCRRIPRMYDITWNKNSARSAAVNNEFINGGLWVCTIFFLVVAAVEGVCSSGLAVWNTVSNPVNVYFSTFGLYIYNGIAAISTLLVLILWGAEFGASLVYNIGILDTLTNNMSSDGRSLLGYSYWFVTQKLLNATK